MSSSDSDSDSNMPSGAECLNRCKRFVELTNTDNALAMFYLQDVEWDLERALDIYFKATQPKNSKVVACFDIDQLNKDEEAYQDKLNEEESKSKKSTEDVKKKHFKLLSWNIDGLDPGNLESRTIGVIKVIQKEEPDLIFFQEVVPGSYEILQKQLEKKYSFLCGIDEEIISHLEPKTYFTMILFNKETCKLEGDSEVIQFRNSIMQRNLLKAKIVYRNSVNISAMTAHLESTVDFSKQRVEQLKLCFDEIMKENDNYYVLFGGDLNLRDSELDAIGGLPNGVYDLWKSTGSRKECLYTWDCSRNTNLKMNGKYKPRCRFDRLFYRQPKVDNEKTRLSPVYFELEGLEKLKSCSRFCSDHWAIQCYFDLVA